MGRWCLIAGQNSLAATICMLAASADLQAAAAGGYLAKTDPSPLRFAPAACRAAIQLLPPLAMSDHPAVATNNLSSATNTTASTPAMQEPLAILATNEISSVTNTNATPDVFGPLNLEPLDSLSVTSAPPVQVTPQMLVEYLMPSPGATNGPQPNLTVPAMINFTPPLLHPRSQAIYESK
jgi:hypothetical protein